MNVTRSKCVHYEPTVNNIAANILIIFECENCSKTERLRWAFIRCFDAKSAIYAIVNHSVHFLFNLPLIVIAWTNNSDEFHLTICLFLIIEKYFFAVANSFFSLKLFSTETWRLSTNFYNVFLNCWWVILRWNPVFAVNKHALLDLFCFCDLDYE